MKKIMKNQFVLSSYHDEFFERFCKLQQGSQSVIEYYKEFLYLMDKTNIKRSPEVFMERFLFGLREELVDIVQRYHYATMEDLVKLAIDREQVQQMIDRHKKRISSTPIFHSSSKPEMKEFREMCPWKTQKCRIFQLGSWDSALVSLNFTEFLVSHHLTMKFLIFVDSLINFGGINMDEKKGRQIAHIGQDDESMVGKIELAHMKDIVIIQWVEKSHQTMVFKPGDWVWIP
ncbi:hypothetical protein Ahy_B06g083176 [Arachis hypogaea]|uniref:Retrotransposon gag domain-containing protein n=1 Tax=Arachis hypogaea TaxID=3818 RepID=A0A444YPC4_ARAHY|nr:hypothetical protein Ahy_B06g083176 [Arachis hypogaea]